MELKLCSIGSRESPPTNKAPAKLAKESAAANRRLPCQQISNAPASWVNEIPKTHVHPPLSPAVRKKKELEVDGGQICGGNVVEINK